jgi:hypothetical protein
VGQLRPQARQQIMVSRIIRALQGRHERQYISRTMTFEYQSAQSQQSSTVMASVVN